MDNSTIMNNLPDSVKKEMNLVSPAQVATATVSETPAVATQSVVQEQIATPVVATQAVVQEQIATPVEDEPFISETFAKLSSGQEALPEIQLPEVPKIQEVRKSTSILDQIVVDLSTIEIVEKSPFKQQNDFETVFNKKATYQVVAVQSGFSAEMSALTMQDINSITNSNVDLYTHKKNVYQAVHAHLENTSVGKIGFTDWMKITSYHDFETLLYGIYCQTFPEKNEFDVTCGSCGKKTTLIVNNETLVETRNNGIVMAKIEEIIRSTKKAEDLVGKSLVHTTLRTMLPDTKIIIDIQTPSLWDHLEMLRSLDQKVIQQFSDTIGTMLFVKNMLMLDVESTIQSGKPKYYELKDRNVILQTLTRLGMTDGKHLEKTINERIEQYAISYSVKNSKCTHCKDSLGNLPVDIETALFTLISKERRG